jgi:hypothetical protein
MPWVWFEPTVPASERAKTVHALDGSATVIGSALHKYVILETKSLEPPKNKIAYIWLQFLGPI